MRTKNRIDFFYFFFCLLLMSASCQCDKSIVRGYQKKEGKSSVKKITNRFLSNDSGSKQSDEMSWPEPVRLAVYDLYKSSLELAPFSAQRLARIGLPAVPAMKFLIDSKKQSIRKRAIISFMLVNLHIFRINDLEKMILDPSRPFVQRSAIEALARIGGKINNSFLSTLGSGMRKRSQTQPIAEFIESVQVRFKTDSWSYSSEELLILDRILQAANDQELAVALEWIDDLSLEKGLHTILSSPSVRLETQSLLARKMAVLASKNHEKLRRFCTDGYSPFLRKDASILLVGSKIEENIRFLEKLSKDPQDPLADYFKELIKRNVMQSIKSATP